MSLLSFQSYPMWVNLLLFTVAAGIIWVAGARLERYTDAIADRTGLGRAFLGMLLLATSTSLPEVATTVTAVLIDNPTLAIHNLLGGVAMQTAILAIADWRKPDRGALTYFTPTFVLLIQGVGLLLLLFMVLAGAATGGRVSIWGVGLWPVLIFLAYLGIMVLTHRHQGRLRWILDQESPGPQPPQQGAEGAGQEARTEEGAAREPQHGQEPQETQERPRGERPYPDRSTAQIYGLFAVASLFVLAAGWAIAQAGDALALQTGLGASFIGATLVAASTSLPEISTTVSAAEHRNYSMAFSNIFGSNALMAALLLLADLLYRPAPILQHVQPSVIFVTALGGILTCIYLWGLLEREDRTVLRLGWDSAAVVSLYLGGLLVLYSLS